MCRKEKSMSDVRGKAVDEAFCSSCGAIIKKEAEICPKCGVRQRRQSTGLDNVSSNWLTLFLLSLFLVGSELTGFMLERSEPAF